MSKVLHRTGDLFDALGEMPIGHGANCMGVMGSGIAVQFRHRFPEMFHIYQRKCKDGTFVPGDIYVYRTEEGYWVMNLATQELPGPNANLNMVQDAVCRASEFCRSIDVPCFALPRIGAGIGGLKWDEVENTISDAIEESGIDVVIYTLPY